MYLILLYRQFGQTICYGRTLHNVIGFSMKFHINVCLALTVELEIHLAFALPEDI